MPTRNPANPPRLPTGRGIDNGPLLFGDRNPTTGRILNSDIAGAGRGLGLPGYGYDIDSYGVVTSGDILNNLNYFAGGSPNRPLPFYGEIGDWPDNLPPPNRPHGSVTVPDDAVIRNPTNLLTVGDLLGADPDYFNRNRTTPGNTQTEIGNFAVNRSIGYFDDARYPQGAEPQPVNGPATSGVSDIGATRTPFPTRNSEVPLPLDYVPSPGQDSYTWNPYYNDSPGSDRYTWNTDYSDTPASGRLPWPDGPGIKLPPPNPEVAVNATGGEPAFGFPPDPDPDLLTQPPPRAGDYFDFMGRDRVAGTNVVPSMNFGDRPMPNLLGFGFGPTIPSSQLGSQTVGSYVSGGDIYLGSQLTDHTPGNGGRTGGPPSGQTVDTIPDGVDDYTAINAQRAAMGLPPQGPHGPGTAFGSGTTPAMDQTSRFSNNGTTGNFTADKTTEGFVAAGGYAGAPNRAVAPDSGHDSFGVGAVGILDPETGMVRRTQSSPAVPAFQMSQLPGAPALRAGDPASAAAYNAWLAQQPEYKAWMQSLLAKLPSGGQQVPGFNSTARPYGGSGG